MERVVEKIDGRYEQIWFLNPAHYWARQARSKWFSLTYVEGWPSFYQVLIDVLTHVGRTIE
ncbi:hypothetical protein SPFM10_00043 [Salmonella phage SPFM10]|nr:hypothetical protein SPFM10_00043 [Salmonella phage SPFM10]